MTEKPNKNLDYLIDSIFQEINRLFVLSFEDKAKRTSYKQYYFLTVEIKNYNFMIDGESVLDQTVK